jgi:DNA-binding transcriptional regulator YhcF (GntR family)
MIRINKGTSVPKYKQIISSIENAILSGMLKKGDKLPSINSIRDEFNLSRDTVLMAFNTLKNRGIIQSVVGKGNYIKSENINIKQKVFLLFDELNTFKEDLFNAFIKNLGPDIEVDIYFHHFNFDVFSIIENKAGEYNYYVIMPANLIGTKAILNKLPDDSVYILDQMPKELEQYSGIYQNFNKDILTNLERLIKPVKKYHTLKLVFSKEKQPIGMLEGFKTFCTKINIPFKVIQSLNGTTLKTGELYIIPDDDDLLKIIKKIKQAGLSLSKDIGIISYNDTLLKEIVADGITTISTDFTAMGKRLAKMISNNEKNQVENPNHLIIRHSL